MKILIVENERLLADSLQDFLTAKGFKVEVVCDGETGKDYATLGTYDLLIMDAAVPEMNTLQVVRQVRANRAQIPIMVLTARSDAQERIDVYVRQGWTCPGHMPVLASEHGHHFP